MSVVYDTGALIAAERRDPSMWAFHDEALAIGHRPVVPVTVLAQAWRGGPQHNLSRLLRGCQVFPDNEGLGRLAGAMCGLSGTSDVVDALVVATAIELDALVVTSDPDDLKHLSASVNQKLVLHTV
jgi:predicted nucleic acid-binding protein